VRGCIGGACCVIRVLHGDCLEVLPTLEAGSVQCVVTSPPYFGLRDYGVAGQIGLEATPAEYVAKMVCVFREVWRVLRDDGTCWLNLGDSYAANAASARGKARFESLRGSETKTLNTDHQGRSAYRGDGIKGKDLMMIPARVALALQADGWYLRSDVIWHKPNPMPESVTDRPTSAHEHVFLLTKSERYFYDADAIKEEAITPAGTKGAKGSAERYAEPGVNSRPPEYAVYDGTRNARNVWTIATAPFAEAHFATFPPDLAERCIKAGSRSGDMVLDPFGGAGTVGLVADRLQRDAVLIELSQKYATMARNRICDDAGLFAEVAD
jgi:DNA modification methylase